MSRLLTFHFQKIRRFAAVRMGTDYQTVLDYWFNELPPKARWASSPEVDQQVQDRFLDLHTSASKGTVCGSVHRAVCIGTARYAEENLGISYTRAASYAYGRIGMQPYFHRSGLLCTGAQLTVRCGLYVANFAYWWSLSRLSMR
jgi:hypothetical protein